MKNKIFEKFVKEVLKEPPFQHKQNKKKEKQNEK